MLLFLLGLKHDVHQGRQTDNKNNSSLQLIGKRRIIAQKIIRNNKFSTQNTIVQRLILDLIQDLI